MCEEALLTKLAQGRREAPAVRAGAKCDDASIAALFRRVWRSPEMGTCESSLASPVGLLSWVACTLVIDAGNDPGAWVVRLLSPFVALAVVAAVLFYRSLRDKKSCVAAGLRGGLQHNSVFCARRGNMSWVSVGEEDEVIGVVVVQGNRIKWLLVDADHRRLGVASSLVAAAERHIFAAENDTCRLLCTSTQTAGLAFYAARGYEEASRSPPSIFGDTDITYAKARPPA